MPVMPRRGERRRCGGKRRALGGELRGVGKNGADLKTQEAEELRANGEERSCGGLSEGSGCLGALCSYPCVAQGPQFGPICHQGPPLANFEHPEQISPPHVHLQFHPFALQTAPFALQCPPHPSVWCLVSPGSPLGPLLPLGCAVQPILPLLLLPKALSETRDPPIYLLVTSETPIFPSSMPQSVLFSSQCAPEPSAQVSALLSFPFGCIPALVPCVSPGPALKKKECAAFNPAKNSLVEGEVTKKKGNGMYMSFLQPFDRCFPRL